MLTLAQKAGAAAVGTTADEQIIEQAFRSAGLLAVLKPQHYGDATSVEQAVEAIDQFARRLGAVRSIDASECWTRTAQPGEVMTLRRAELNVSQWQEYSCAGCNAQCSIAHTFHVCARCRTTHYCSAARQKAHWKASHKANVCLPRRAEHHEPTPHRHLEHGRWHTLACRAASAGLPARYPFAVPAFARLQQSQRHT